MSQKVILLVDDEEDLRSFVAMNLQEAGYEILVAGNGNEAYDVFMNYLPDLLIVDFLLPEMNGKELVERIREQDIGKHTPTIILTARSLMRDYFEDIHIDKFISKPFETEELLNVIKEIFNKYDRVEETKNKLKNIKRSPPKDTEKKGIPKIESPTKPKICERCQSSVDTKEIRCPYCGCINLHIEKD